MSCKFTAQASGGNLALRNVRFEEVGCPVQITPIETLTIRDILALHTSLEIGNWIVVYPERIKCWDTFYPTTVRDIFVFNVYRVALKVLDLSLEQRGIIEDRQNMVLRGMRMSCWVSNAD